MTIIINTLLTPDAPDGAPEITVATIINRAAILLQDTDNTRWTREELLGWLNEAQRQVVMMQPSATATTISLALVTGVKQRIPDDGWQLLDVTHNLGVDGQTPGRVIRIVSRKLLDAQDLNWTSATPSDVVQNYIANLQDGNDEFYVYPPNTGRGHVEAVYSRVPTDLTSESDKLGVHLIYQNALVDYIVYRAASKDAEHAPMLALAQMYQESFRTAVLGVAAAEAASDTNQMLKGTT